MQDIIHKTVETVLSSIDIETVAVAETNMPTQRYKFDSALFTLYPWLKRMKSFQKLKIVSFITVNAAEHLVIVHTVGLLRSGCVVGVVVSMGFAERP